MGEKHNFLPRAARGFAARAAVMNRKSLLQPSLDAHHDSAKGNL
jgi:hypothetical protein